MSNTYLVVRKTILYDGVSIIADSAEEAIAEVKRTLPTAPNEFLRTLIRHEDNDNLGVTQISLPK